MVLGFLEEAAVFRLESFWLIIIAVFKYQLHILALIYKLFLSPTDKAGFIHRHE